MSENGYLGWGEVAPQESSKSGKIEYLWLKSGGTYKIRPIHLPVRFYKYFHKDENNKLRTAICAEPDTCPVGAAHPELQKPTARYAIWVIDRNDGKAKVMEGPKTVFAPFRKSYEATGHNPGGLKDGGDWQIEVNGTGKNTKYTSTFCGDNIVTQDEKELLKEAMDGDKDKLKNLYKINTTEEIEKRLFGSWEQEGSSAQSNFGSFEVTSDDSDDGSASDATTTDDDLEDLEMDW